MHDSQRRFLSALGAGLVALVLLAPALVPATAAEEDAASEQARAIRGKATYRVYCGNCHGEDAEGDGKLAALLTVQPADLTRLAKGNEGEFPAERVRKSIDGRVEVRGHGRREMPVWGDVFQPTEGDPLDPQQVQTMEKRIDELVAYLRTLQVSD